MDTLSPRAAVQCGVDAHGGRLRQLSSGGRRGKAVEAARSLREYSTVQYDVPLYSW